MTAEPTGEEHACDLLALQDVRAPLVLGRPEACIPPPPCRVEPIIGIEEWALTVTLRHRSRLHPRDLTMHEPSIADGPLPGTGEQAFGCQEAPPYCCHYGQ